jgi:hypothetical protein
MIDVSGSQLARAKNRLGHVLAAMAAVLCATSGWGQTLYWDPAASGPSGTWDAITANWTTDPTGASPTVVWTNGSPAVFSANNVAGGNYTVTLSGTQTAGAITFANGVATLTGDTLALSDGSTVTVNASPIQGIIASVIAGTNGLTKLSSGELVLQAANTLPAI